MFLHLVKTMFNLITQIVHYIYYIGQVNGDYEANEGQMLQYLNLVQHQMSRLHEVKLTRIPREQNTAADQLARSTSSNEPNDELEVIRHSSLQTIEENPIETETCWTTPIISYLERGTLPNDCHEARRIKVCASRFTILQGTQYKKGFSLPYLRCLAPEEAEYVLREIHEGICGNHSGARLLSKKVIRAGYYWPSIQADANLLVRHCDKCQQFANLLHSPSEELTPMSSPWPFAQWGLDIMGPLSIEGVN